MRLNTLHLENFKNYRSLDLDLSDVNILILVGNNGQGKTNLLESIVILGLSKSFHSHPLKEMVNWYLHEEETGLPDFFSIECDLTSSGSSQKLQVICGKTRQYPKTLKVNGVKTDPKDYVGNLRIILFTPEDLNMIMLSPQLRRRYINILISQLDPVYLEHLSLYQGVLKQRNRLLTHIKDQQSQPDELSYWDAQLVEHGSYLL